MLIIDMPMPKEGGCHIAVDWDGHSFVCPIKKKTCDYFFTKERPSWCPIKGVLPDEHGDLIDRDALYMKIKSHNTERPDRTYRMGLIAEKHICLDDICRAEAVIKAERKDDEQIH